MAAVRFRVECAGLALGRPQRDELSFPHGCAQRLCQLPQLQMRAKTNNFSGSSVILYSANPVKAGGRRKELGQRCPRGQTARGQRLALPFATSVSLGVPLSVSVPRFPILLTTSQDCC